MASVAIVLRQVLKQQGLYYFDDHIKTTFFGLLGDFIERHYNVKCDKILFGEEGVSTEYMVEHIDEIVAENPDVVMIEFGMNDHVIENAEDNVESFYNSMLDCVEKLQRSGIDVILIGFFQQNECWVNENTENTILYNHTIADVAKKSGIPFVDI